jgi:hypothetical protein
MHTATGAEVTEEIKTEASGVPRQRREFFSLDDKSSTLVVISAALVSHAALGGLPGR